MKANIRALVIGPVDFQGTGSYVDLGAPESLQFTGDFTLAVWVNMSTGAPGNQICPILCLSMRASQFDDRL